MLLKRETYNTYASFVQGTKGERSEWAKQKGRNSSEEGSESFSGTPSLNAAYDLCVKGWDAGIAALDIDTDSTDGNGFEVVYDVTGETIDIGAFMDNTPECMLKFQERTPRDMQRLKIYIPLTYTSSVDLDKALKFSVNLINLVNKAQANNDVEIIGIFGNDTREEEAAVNGKGKSTNTIDFVTLKPYGQRLVLNNIAAALHPSFFRRIWFKHSENSGNTFGYGYGSTLSSETMHKYIVKSKELYKDPYLFTPNLDDLGSAALIKQDEIKTNLAAHKLKEIF